MPDSHFADRLLSAIEAKRSHVVVGVDPNYELLPPEILGSCPRSEYGGELESKVACYRAFLIPLLETLRSAAVGVKIQVAYFEELGALGYRLYEELVSFARELGYVVIADAKRGDIGSTAEAYAKAHMDLANADALTVNPYFGSDGLDPFFRRARDGGKGVFVLVKTSNPSSREIQDLTLSTGETVYEHVADMVNCWSKGTTGESGYCSIGAVVGGTHEGIGGTLRRRMPGIPFLVPGYGAQGARAEDLAPLFDANGTGAVVNSSRSILYAYRNRALKWRKAALQEAEEMRLALWSVSRHV